LLNFEKLSFVITSFHEKTNLYKHQYYDDNYMFKRCIRQNEKDDSNVILMHGLEMKSKSIDAM